MARTKIFRRSSDNSLTNTWTPVLEGYGADVAKTPWLAEYAHNHAIFDNTGSALFENAPGTFFQQPTSLGSYMGQANPATRGVNGSGDKFPSLLPVAIQVAAKTIGFDLVPVIPMDSPVGFLPYLDYIYTGGRVDNPLGAFQPYMIKLTGLSAGEITTVKAKTESVPGTFDGDGEYAYVGLSRIDGNPIVKILQDTATTVLTQAVVNEFGAGTKAELVSALENHISGFTSTSDEDYDSTKWAGPYMPATGQVPGSMKREQGEVSKFRQMGLKMFTKFVEAETDQVSISATVEQIQDLNRVWNYDVVSMLENVAVNDLAQSINKRLVDSVFQLADTHNDEITIVEGAGITTLDLAAGLGGFENVSTMQRRFVTKVLELANLIYHRGRFGAATFLVTNGRIASALADVAGYSIAQVPTDMAGVAGNLYPAGKVYGVQVYVDPNLAWSDTRVSLGRKGADEEPGVKFMPYIMAESLQTISEGTFSPKIGMKSRYAITEAGWHPETQYCNMEILGDIGVLTGSVAPSN